MNHKQARYPGKYSIVFLFTISLVLLFYACEPRVKVIKPLDQGDDTGTEQIVQNQPAQGAPITPYRSGEIIPIADILNNPGEFAGKLVTVSGECVKINPGIMDRNWIHLEDASVEEKDLTITSLEYIEVGQMVTLQGIIAVGKDFGAGYQYDVIMEGASLLQL